MCDIIRICDIKGCPALAEWIDSSTNRAQCGHHYQTRTVNCNNCGHVHSVNEQCHVQAGLNLTPVIDPIQAMIQQAVLQPQFGLQQPQFGPQFGLQQPQFGPQFGLQQPQFGPQFGLQQPQFGPQFGLQPNFGQQDHVHYVFFQ